MRGVQDGTVASITGLTGPMLTVEAYSDNLAGSVVPGSGV